MKLCAAQRISLQRRLSRQNPLSRAAGTLVGTRHTIFPTLARSHGPFRLLSWNLSCAGKGGRTCCLQDLSWASTGCSLGGCEAKSGPLVPLPVTEAGSKRGWGLGGVKVGVRGVASFLVRRLQVLLRTWNITYWALQSHCLGILDYHSLAVGSQRWISFKRLGPACTLVVWEPWAWLGGEAALSGRRPCSRSFPSQTSPPPTSPSCPSLRLSLLNR